VNDFDRAAGNDRLGRIAELLERSGIPLEEIARVDKVRIGEHQTAIKLRREDGTDELRTVTAAADSLVLTPVWGAGPAWPVVHPAQPVRVAASKATPATDCVTAVILPDSQVGFWDLDDGMVPMHDPAALAVAVEVVRRAKPHHVVVLGDLLDLGEASTKWLSTPTFQRTVQASLDAAHAWLAQVRAAAPAADVHLLEGNHDRRLSTLIQANAAAAFGLRRANTPADWPVLSLAHLLHLDDLNIRWHAGYPAGRVWLRDDVMVHHGTKVSAHKASRDPMAVSTIQGHTHRLGATTRTLLGHGGHAMHTVHVECGTLARIDGAVPSVHGSVDDSGRPVAALEDWQQGLVVLSMDPAPGDLPTVELVPINQGRARWRGTSHTSGVADALEP
jgi:hypothetical protein